MFLEIRKAMVSVKSLAAHGIEADKPERMRRTVTEVLENTLMTFEFSLN